MEKSTICRYIIPFGATEIVFDRTPLGTYDTEVSFFASLRPSEIDDLIGALQEMRNEHPDAA